MTDILTVAGNVATEPEFKMTANGIAIASFRVASTQRRWDRATGAWVDDGTNWYRVSTFRGLAEHVSSSVHVGQPVIVTGRLRIREWEAGEKRGTSIDLDADVVGHDLRWGTATFAKTAGSGTAGSPGAAPAAAPAAEQWATPGSAPVQAATASHADASLTPF